LNYQKKTFFHFLKKMEECDQGSFSIREKAIYF